MGTSLDAVRSPRRVDVVGVDPDLLGPPGTQPPKVAAPPVAELSLCAGAWLGRHESGTLGLLVLSGFLTRRVELAGRRSVELLGQGDLLRPSEPDSDEFSMIPAAAQWSVLQAAKLAVLDARFTKWATTEPAVLDQILSRLIRRSRTLALRLAIVKLPRLSSRLHFLLWHLADRFGQRGTTGVLLRIPITHETLADLVSATRPAVSSAMKELDRAGLACPLTGGGWTLCGHRPMRGGKAGSARSSPISSLSR